MELVDGRLLLIGIDDRAGSRDVDEDTVARPIPRNRRQRDPIDVFVRSQALNGRKASTCYAGIEICELNRQRHRTGQAAYAAASYIDLADREGFRTTDGDRAGVDLS
jgi:hypothetical protein